MKKTLSVFLAVILVLSVSLTVFAGDRTYAGDETYYNKTADNTLLTKQASYDFSGNPTDFGGITATATKAESATYPDSFLYYNDKYLSFYGNNGGNLYVTTSALTDKKLSNFYMTFGFKSMGVWNQSQVRFGVIDDRNYYALRFRSSSWSDTSKNQIALVKYTNNAESVVTSVNTTANIENTDFAVKLFVNGTYVTAEVTDGTNTYPLFATLDNKEGDIKLFVSSNNAGFADINIYEYTGTTVGSDYIKNDIDVNNIPVNTNSTGSVTSENGKITFDGNMNKSAYTTALGNGAYNDFALEFKINSPKPCAWVTFDICFGGTSINDCYALRFRGPSQTDGTANTVSLVKKSENTVTTYIKNILRGSETFFAENGNYDVKVTMRDSQLQMTFVSSTDRKTVLMPILYDFDDIYSGGNVFLYCYAGIVPVENLALYDLSDEAMLKAFDDQKGYVNRYGFDSADVVPSTGITNGYQPTVSFGALKYSSTKVDNSKGSDANTTYSENLNGEGKNWSDFYCSFDYTHGRTTWGVTEFNFRQRIEDNKNTSAFKYKIRFDACAKDSNNSVIPNQLNISLIESYYDTQAEEETLGTISYNSGDLTNQVYHVEISAVGNEIKVFIDGEEKFNVTDNTHTSGATMIYTQDSAATLDNFFLYNYAKDGDLDESNEVDILDLVLLSKNATLKNSLYADVDNNGTANEDADFTALRNIILGK